MNPILEEEDSGSESGIGEVPSRSSVHFIPSFTYVDESPMPYDSTDDTFSSLTEAATNRADSLAKWRDFKPTTGRVSEGATNQEAFPVLVRRLEVETGPMVRKNSLTKDGNSQKREFDDSPIKGRTEAASFSLSATEFIKFDKQRSIDSAEEEDMKVDGSISPARHREPTIVDRVLDLQMRNEMTPEDLLAMAIFEKETPNTGRRGSIWNSFGSKRKAEEVMREAMTEWQDLKQRVSDLTKEKSQLYDDIDAMKRSKNEKTKANAELTDTINTTSAVIKETRKSRKAARDSYSRECETQQMYHQRLLDDHVAAVRDTTEHLTQVMEEEERWCARIEELCQILLTVEAEHTEAARDREEYQSLLPALMSSNQEFEEQQRQTELCLELLADAMDYFSQSQEHIQFNAVFCELLKGLKQATVEAIEAEKTFERQALTDPRELMPYKRASDHVSGTY